MFISPTGSGGDPLRSGSGPMLFTNPVPPWAYQPAPLPNISPDQASTNNGLDPSQFADILYGKPIPVLVGGLALIGCRIIEGPWFDKGTNAAGATVNTVSMIVGAAIAADPTGTRTIRQVRFNGDEVWNSTTGSSLAGLSISFNTGTETQLPFAQSIARYGNAAVAYRPLICASIDNLPLDTFNNEVPFVSLLIADSTFGAPELGITNANALNTLAAFANLATTEFDASTVTGSEQAFILEQQRSFIEWLQDLRKIHPDWSILTNDKLRVIEKSPTVIDLSLTRAMILSNGDKPISFMHDDPLTVPREKNYRFIDADRDYEPSVVTARREREPIASTASANSETLDLPIVSHAATAISLVNFSLYADELAREKAGFVGKVSLLAMEPGDSVQYNTGFRLVAHRITETGGNANWTADIKTAGFLAYTLAGGIEGSGGIFPGSLGRPTSTDDLTAEWLLAVL